MSFINFLLLFLFSCLNAASAQASGNSSVPIPTHFNVIPFIPHPQQAANKRSPQGANPPPPLIQPNAFVCNEVNFGGTCLLVPGTDGVCWSLLHDPSWNQHIAAFGPDQGLSCVIYTAGECDEYTYPGAKSMTLEYPGIADLSTVGFAGNIQSWTCSRI